MKNFALIVLLSIICTPLFAQSGAKRVTDVKGKYQIHGNISEDQAKKMALQEAKSEALRKAGVSESVYSVFGLISNDENQMFKEVYSEMSIIAIDGLINVKNVEYSMENFGQDRYAVATIDAEVKKGDQPDKSFILDVSGLSSVYKDQEDVNFSVKVYGADSYLTIFWFDEKGGEIIFPNQLESNTFVPKGTTKKFPYFGAYLNDPSSDFETVNLMIVASKYEKPYRERKVTFESVLKWIYDIPVQKRCAYHKMVTIKR